MQEIEKLLIKKHRGYYLKYFSLIFEIEVKKIAEIGVFRGKNAKVLRALFPQAELTLIDPWQVQKEYLASGTAVTEQQKIFDQARSETRLYFENDPHTAIFEMTGEKAVPLLPDDFDLIFIDANHAYAAVRKEILIWKEKVRPGGILAGHNYGRNTLPGVKQAVDELFPKGLIVGQDEVWIAPRVPQGEEISHRRGLEPLTT